MKMFSYDIFENELRYTFSTDIKGEDGDYQKRESSTFAGGCFWCMIEPFDEMLGIHNVVAGYGGGNVKNPSYEEVVKGITGHREVIQITYEPHVFSYEKLLDIFWKSIDPTDEGGQFHDRGEQYKTAVFYHNEIQKKLALESKQELKRSKKFSKPIATDIIPFKNFYLAEEEHQNYYKKNVFHYSRYYEGSGRKDFLQQRW